MTLCESVCLQRKRIDSDTRLLTAALRKHYKNIMLRLRSGLALAFFQKAKTSPFYLNGLFILLTHG